MRSTLNMGNLPTIKTRIVVDFQEHVPDEITQLKSGICACLPCLWQTRLSDQTSVLPRPPSCVEMLQPPSLQVPEAKISCTSSRAWIHPLGMTSGKM